MLVFHIDVNNAFLSWESVERLKYPKNFKILDLRRIPSAIGGNKENRHGIILAKSPPAKAYGIKTAETLHEALKKCPQLIIVPPRMEIYRKYSVQLMELLSHFSDTVEKYSIDEAFLDMSGTELLFGPPATAAEYLRQTIYDELGFTVNIGISTNKLLAKMASDFEKPNKVHTLFPEEIPTKMWPLPVQKLFFVGQASHRILYNLGIHTIGQLASAPISTLKSHLGRHGELLYSYANGICPEPVCGETTEAKGYGNSTTLSYDVTDKTEAKSVLLTLCESVASRLRKDNAAAGVISVTIKDFTFRSISHQHTLASPSNVTNELFHHSCLLFDECWKGMPIRLLGVSTSRITETGMRQLNLLEQEKYLREEKLDSAIDSIRNRFGNDAIQRASFLSTRPKKSGS